MHLALISIEEPDTSEVCMTRRVITISGAVEAMPVIVLIDSYLETKLAGPKNSYSAYQRVLNDFLQFSAHALELRLPALLWADVKEDLCELYRCALANEYKETTVRQRLAILKAFGSWVKEKHQGENVFDSLKLPSLGNHDFIGLSESQVEALKTSMERVFQYKPIERFVVELLLGTGLRCDEARNLTLGQLSDGWTHLIDVLGKGGKTRKIPIPRETRRALVRYMDWRKSMPHKPEHPLLASKHGYKQRDAESLKVSNKTIYRYVNKVLLNAGAPKRIAHPHTLRHTYAYKMLDHIGSKEKNPMRALEMVAKLLGHSSIQTTMRYVTKHFDYYCAVVEDFSI